MSATDFTRLVAYVCRKLPKKRKLSLGGAAHAHAARDKDPSLAFYLAKR